MPVIIWSEAALAGYITRNGCGITVDSIEEIPGRLRALSAEEYEAIRANTMKISERLRKGKYTTRALRKALGEEG